MSLLLPLLLAGALIVPSSSSNTSIDDKNPRARRAVVDTAAHRQVAADLVVRARHAAEAGSLQQARADLMVANTMLRETGGTDESTAYALVHINFALDRYSDAGDVLLDLSDEALKKGNATLAARAAVDAAELYSMGGQRTMVAASVSRVRSLLNDSRISESDRNTLKKRVG